MESFIGLSGVINCPIDMGIMIKSIQVDVTNPATTDVLVTVSGSLGNEWSFNAVSPVVLDLRFAYNEDVNVFTTGTSLNTVVINYVKRGTQNSYMMADPSRIKRPPVGKWKV